MARHSNTSAPLCRYAAFWLTGRLLRALGPLLVGVTFRLTPALLAYLTGLITQENITATVLASQVGVVSHDDLTRLLRNIGPGLSAGACWAVRLATRLGADGWLIIDDVLLPKPFAQALAFAGWDYDHASNRNTYGLRLVFVVWCNGVLLIPLLFTCWQKDLTKKPARPKRAKKKKSRKKAGPPCAARNRKRKKPGTNRPVPAAPDKKVARLASGARYRTKNQLAQAMLWKLVRRGLPVRYVLFDNWYASDANLLRWEKLGLHWVTRAKSNLEVEAEGQKVSVKQLGETVRKANYHYYPQLGARARSFLVRRRGRLLLLVIIQNDSGPESGRTKYLLTSDLELTTRGVVQWYRRRWPIEVFFRDAKQHLGLGKCEARSAEAIVGHIFLVCVAYSLLQVSKPAAAAQKASICGVRGEWASLLVVVQVSGELAARQHRKSGRLQEIALGGYLSPARTRLALPEMPEQLVFTRSYADAIDSA